MATIFRVEHNRDGRGPYHTGNWDGWSIANAHSNETHPPSWREGLKECFWEHDKYGNEVKPARARHGFATFEELMRWFEKWEKRLDEAGFVIRRYDVPEGRYSRGKFQTVFDHRYATER